MYSKIVLISLITILTGLVLFLSGYLLSSNDLDQTASIGRLERFEGEDVVSSFSTPRLRRLSTVKVLGPTISESGKKVLFFEADTGKVMSSDFEGKNVEVLSGKVLTNVSDASWSPNGNEALLSQRSRGSLGYSYFNLKTGQLTALPAKLSDPAWSYHGKKIAYLYFDPAQEEGSISIADPDSSFFSNVLATRIRELKFFWPKENLLSFYNRGSEIRSLFALDLTTNALTSVFGPVANLQALWSPDASKVLLSYNLYQQKKISYLDLSSHSEVFFDLLTTAQKCVWSTNAIYLYCGGKEHEEQLEGLYVIDAKTKKITNVFTPPSMETFRIDRPFLTPAEDFLIFVNGYDQYLYSISL